MAVDQDNGQVDPLVPESYEHLLEDYSQFAPPAADEVVQGTVLGITAKDVIIDFGYKSEGIVPIDQFQSPTGELTVKRGDVVDVMIDRSEHVEGYQLLSHTKAARLRIWDDLERASNDQLILSGRVLGRVKGGLAVDVGVKAFMPGSQADPRPVHNLDSLIGQDIPVKIIKLNRRRGNVVVSRKLALEEEINSRKSVTLEHLSEGATVVGTVKNLTEYGAFIDLGGIDGLLHVTDMSYGRITHPSEMLQVGQDVTVKILKFDRAKERVSLGIKQLEPDPWDTVLERYPVESRVIGRVVNVTDYGAFVELEGGVEGLIHISEMTWSRRMKHPSKVVRAGDQVEAVVLEVHSRDRRISLGLKQLEPNPWTTIDSRYSVGSVVEGRVRNMTDFGAFIEIEEGIDGLVHVSALSWTKRVKHPSEIVKKGEKVKAVVLGVEPQNRRLSLGIKQLQPDVWESFFAAHRVGDVVHGKVLRTAQFGAFVEIAEGVEGLCHISEAGDEGGGPSKLQTGLEHDFKIIKINVEEKKVGLSLRAVGREASRAQVETYKKEAHKAPVSSSTTTLGDLINWKNER